MIDSGALEKQNYHFLESMFFVGVILLFTHLIVEGIPKYAEVGSFNLLSNHT